MATAVDIHCVSYWTRILTKIALVEGITIFIMFDNIARHLTKTIENHMATRYTRGVSFKRFPEVGTKSEHIHRYGSVNNISLVTKY